MTEISQNVEIFTQQFSDNDNTEYPCFLQILQSYKYC